MNSKADAFKMLPAVDKVLLADALQPLIEKVGIDCVKQEARTHLDRLREEIVNNEPGIVASLESSSFLENLYHSIKEKVEARFASSLVPVINLSGTVVHTNLGRARLPLEAVESMSMAATHATNLEYDLETGKRGDRDAHLEARLRQLTGAEAATVVNNNAAAVLLVLNTLACDKEVIISRGELVEIGGAFRIPDVMKSASCTLKEIGTTNRTHLRDYESAIGNATGLIMKVHTSNYEIRGFTNSVPESELSELAHRHDLPFVSDLGSGTLVELTRFGLPHEPTVGEALVAGADLVTFSGDKLLGGPQAGIIVGKASLIERIKRNPLKRALRVDKITLAALSAVLDLYQDPDRLSSRLPLLVDLTRPLAEIEKLAEKLLPILERRLAGKAEIHIEASKSQIGSGALPLDLLDSCSLVLRPIAEKGQSDAALTRLARAFRELPCPVIGRVHDGSLIFDLRCLWDEEAFVTQLESLAI